MIAWLTQRTLVIPPDTPWYLIDKGPIAWDQPREREQVAWPDWTPRQNDVSNFDIWFDLFELSLVVPTITTAEFIRREYENREFGIPQKFDGGKVVNEDVEMGRQWMRWLNKRATEWNVNLPWGQLGNFVYWPSQDAVQRNNGKMIDGEWVDNRKGREYTESLSNALIIHFQSPDGHDGMSLCDKSINFI